jgi:WD40 repeat protein
MRKIILLFLCLLPLCTFAQLPKLLLQTEHAQSVEQIAFSEDGRYYATASADGTIYIWDAISNLQVYHLQLADFSPVDLSFIPNTHFLIADDGTYLWRINANNGQFSHLPISFPGTLTAFAVDRGGQYLATAFDISTSSKSVRTIKIWDIVRNQWLASHKQKNDYVNAIDYLVFNEKGDKLYASGQIADILEWSWTTEITPKTMLPLQLMSQEALTISPSGKYSAFVSGVLGTPMIGIWNNEQQEWHHQFPFPDRVALNQIVFSEDEQYLVAAFQKGVYDATSFFEEASTKGYLLGYDLTQFDEKWRLEQNGGFLDMAVLPNTTSVITVDINRNIQSFNMINGRKNQDFGVNLTALNGLAIDSTNQWLWLGGEHGNINAWSLTEGIIRQQRKSKFEGRIDAIGLHNTSQSWAVASRNQVAVYDRFDQLIDEFTIAKGQVKSLLFTKDGSELAVVATNQFEVFTNTLQLLEGLNTGRTTSAMEDLYVNPASLTIRNIKQHTSRPWSSQLNYPGMGTEIQMHPLADHLLMAGEQGLSIFDINNGQLTGPEPLHEQTVIASAFSPGGRYLATGGLDPYVSLIDLSTGEPYQIQDVRDMVHAIAFSADDRQLAFADGNTIQLWQLDPFEEKKECVLKGDLTYLQFTSDGQHLIAAGPEIGITLWDHEAAKQLITMVPVGQSEFLSYTPDGFYRASKNGVRGAAFSQNGQTYTFDQFDQHYNRPDLILKTLNHPNEALISAYERAYTLRNSKTPGSSGFEIPIITHLSTASPTNTLASSIRVKVSAVSDNSKLKLLHTSTNGVPVEPILLTSSYQINQEMVLPLLCGSNQIQVAVEDEQGVRSLQHRIEVFREAEAPKPRLFFVGLGSNEFPNANRPLDYAEKDVLDILKVLKENGAYSSIDTLLLLGTSFTKENFTNARSFLEKAGPEDRIIVMASSHGLQGEQGAFYLATHDTDFDYPAEKAITFNALDSLLSYLNCPYKLLLLDACHTGEVQQSGTMRAEGGATIKTFKGNENTTLLAQTDFELMKDLFVDLNRHSGAFVISASARGQVSVEDPTYQNGVFTYVLKRVLEKPYSEKVTVKELQKVIAEKVPRFTDGAQQPAFRQENVLWDWSLW